ncbi:putative deoxynucleotide monophosphate kinase [Xylophilus phage Lumi]|nr:putative deoxynucleotide monophosphate kinase [Xylophilus phage Lumi]
MNDDHLIHRVQKGQQPGLSSLRAPVIIDDAVRTSGLLAEASIPKGSPAARKVIVGLAGEAGAGKSYLADYLVENYGAVKSSFASPLKKMLKCLGLTDAELWGDEKEIPNHKLLLGRTPRHAMQTLGTEWGRQRIHPDIWAQAWKNMLLEDQPTFTVIEDVRFVNEVEAIRSLGGRVVGIRRGAERRKVSAFTAMMNRRKKHPSENFDTLVESTGMRVIYNNSTVENLAEQAMQEVR